MKGSVRDASLLFAISSDHLRNDHPSRSYIEETTGQRLDGRTSSWSVESLCFLYQVLGYGQALSLETLKSAL